ncbi:MAG: hypothetical protein ACK5LL_03835 [Suipraeoptans sp.]
MNKNKTTNSILLILFALLCALILASYPTFVGVGSEINHHVFGLHMIKEVLLKTVKDFRFYLILIVMLLFTFSFWKYGNKITTIVYKYRFVIAVVIFIICILFEINGSSIGVYNTIYGETDSGVLLGVSRNIRSDEYGTSTAMLFSQYHTEGDFSYYSDLVRGGNTDVFLLYGQPVKNIAMIFRPFQLGYLFLPLAKGLSFYWCGRMIALLLVSFEFAMLITKKKKGLSLAYACLIGLAPVVQWWFATNGFVDMLIFMQLSIIMLYAYMGESNIFKRLIYLLVIVICAGGYIFTVYPAWQIPLIFILLALIIWVFLERVKECQMKVIDWIMVLGAVILLVSLSLYILNMSKETIEALANTAYPGKRNDTGGGTLNALFNYPSSIWISMTNEGNYVNQCESARFIDFSPLSILLPYYVVFKEKKKDKLMIPLMVTQLLLFIYCFCGLPDIIAKITFLSKSQTDRAIIALGLCNIILLIRAMNIMEKKISIKLGLLFSAILSTIVVYVSYLYDKEYYTPTMLLLTLIVMAAMFFGILCNKLPIARRIFVIGAVLISILAGSLVNPIRKGVDDVVNIPQFNEIRKVIENDKDAKWIAVDMPLVTMNNVPMMNGASTFNTINVYPNFDFWEKIDINGDYEKIYNRYAHIKITITNSQATNIALGETPDVVVLTLNVSDIEKLNIKYIYTNTDLSKLIGAPYQCKKVGENIYKMGN